MADFAASCSSRQPKTPKKAGKPRKERNPDGKLECPICAKTYETTQGLSKHMKTHSGQPVMCTFCKKECSTEAELKRHTEGSGKDKVPDDMFCRNVKKDVFDVAKLSSKSEENSGIYNVNKQAMELKYYCNQLWDAYLEDKSPYRLVQFLNMSQALRSYTQRHAERMWYDYTDSLPDPADVPPRPPTPEAEGQP
jgi:hypothetical protein